MIDDRGLTRTAAVAASLGGIIVVALSIAMASTGPFTQAFIVGALVPYSVGAFILVSRVGAHHPHDRFGIANTLTTTRLVLASLLGGLMLDLAISGPAIDQSLAWSFFAVATGAMILDGFDGFAARKQGLASVFGSRFDMEVDALQILLLSAIAFMLGKAGAWVLISGALRYLYALGGMLWEPLNEPLPPSWRRKIISVLQGGALAALLAPVITPPVSILIAAIAVIFLIYSFSVDVAWIARVRAANRISS